PSRGHGANLTLTLRPRIANVKSRRVNGCAPRGAQPFLVRSVAAAARVSAASSPAAPALLVARLADVDLPATDVATVHLGDGLAGLARRAHLHDAEATGAASGAGRHHRDRTARAHTRDPRPQ